MKKTRKPFLFIILVMIFAIALPNCDRKAKKDEERLKQELKDKEFFNELAYRKEAVLLAIKYDIEEDTVFNLLVEVIETQEISKDNTVTKSRLNSLAEKYNIPVRIVANIIVDYYSMQTYVQLEELGGGYYND